MADASHELKTPLTVITTNAELMQQRGLDEESRERLSGNVLSMARHMRTLLEQMLELAKGDASGPPASTGRTPFRWSCPWRRSVVATA